MTTKEETFEGNAQDFRGMMHSIFAVLIPVALLGAIFSGLAYSYQRFGAAGVLCVFIAVVALAAIGELATREEKVDSESSES